MKALMQWAVTSSALILIVLAVRVLFRNRLSARLRYALWGVVLLRLLIPFQVELPAAVSGSLPVLASNLTPDAAQWEERSIPVFPQGRFAAFGFSRADLHQLEPGEIIPTDTSIGYWQKSQNGETITRYLDLWSPAQMAAAVWTVGAGGSALVILLSNLCFALRLKKRRKRLEVPAAPIPVYTAEGLPSPCLFGVLRPAVYVTPRAAEHPEVLRHVLAHELTHYAHKDHLWSLLRCLALALHWYNPLVWLAAGLSKQDGELACDEGAVQRLGERERIPYGRTLVDTVAARSARPADLLSCSTAMTGGGRSVRQRVAALVNKPQTVKTALFAAAAVIALGLVFTFASRGEGTSSQLNAYLTLVEESSQLTISPPPISSQFFPPILDDDLLVEAKAALTDVTPASDQGWQPPEDLWLSPCLSLNGDASEYALVWRDGRTDICFLRGGRWSDNPDPVPLARTDRNLVSLLQVLVQRQAIRNQDALPPAPPADSLPQEDRSALLGDLTQEQVDRINEAFEPFVELSDNVYGTSEISCFFTSNYDDPTQINLEEFLRYCPIGVSSCLDEGDTEEFLAVMELDNSWFDPDRELHSPNDLPVPVHRYPREEVSALLQKYADITVEQLDWTGCLYVEEYDAFYNFTSDAGPGVFPCAGGQFTQDGVLLWSEPDETGERCELTLRKSGERWLIQSHHTIYER